MKRCIMKTKQKAYWWVDLVLFVGFLAAFFLSFTGVELHQWIGFLGGLLAIYHLLAHWDWVKVVSRKILRTTNDIVRLKFWVDSIMLVGFMLILGSGLVISTWLNISLSNYSSWLRFHILCSILTLLVLLGKLALHWRWISKMTGATFSKTAVPAIKPVNLQTVQVEERSLDRQDFLKVMGVVAGGSLLALLSATKSLATLEGVGANTASETSVSDLSAGNSSQSGVSQSSAWILSSNNSCSIQCAKRCSFPGQCHRYVDTNNNNLCDNGECM